MKMKNPIRSLCLAALLLLTALPSYSQLKIKSLELNLLSNYSDTHHFKSWSAASLQGMELNFKLGLQHQSLPEALGFFVGLHQRQSYWVDGISPGVKYWNEAGDFVGINFGEAQSLFDRDALSRFLLSVGASYTLPMGKSWGWTSELSLLCSPYSKSRVPYTLYKEMSGEYWIKTAEGSQSLSNGMSLGIGFDAGIWYKLPIAGSLDYRLGLKLGYQYMDQLYAHRQIEVDGMKPMSDFGKSINHIVQCGVSLIVVLP